MPGTPTLPRATILERLSRLRAEGRPLLDAAALFQEPFGPPPGAAALAPGLPRRLYLLGDHPGPLQRPIQGELPETASLDGVVRWLEAPDAATLDARYLPLDHPEGLMARFNRWFYVSQGERAFEEGLVPTSLATDPELARAEAALLVRLARRSNHPPRVLKLGAGCEVEPVSLFFRELAGRDPELAARCQVVFTDLAPSLLEEAERRARLDPELSGLLGDGRLQLRLLDACRPDLGQERFTLIHSSYLYDSLPQRELARVGGRWYELKARLRLAAWPELDEFRRLLLANDLEGLRAMPTDYFHHLGWQTVLDPLPTEAVPHLAELEAIYAGPADMAVPVSDALLSGLEALLPHLAPGGALQTFDLTAPAPGEPEDRLQGMFKGPGRICGALYLGQNFALVGRLLAGRGLKVSLLPPERYLEEALGEEAVCCEQLWEALVPEALEEPLGAAFVARHRGCLEGEGGRLFREAVEATFLTRSRSRALGERLEALGLEGRLFVRGLFEAKERVRDEEGLYEQFRVEVP